MIILNLYCYISQKYINFFQDFIQKKIKCGLKLTFQTVTLPTQFSTTMSTLFLPPPIKSHSLKYAPPLIVYQCTNRAQNFALPFNLLALKIYAPSLSTAPHQKNKYHFVIFNYENTFFHKIGHISANTGPILKIQNLASSGEQPASAAFAYGVARDAMREMTSRACGDPSDCLMTSGTITPVPLRDVINLATNVMPPCVANQRHAI